MTSHRTLKTAYPFIKHIPVSLAKAKARTAAARESAWQEQQDTTEKNVKKVFGLFCLTGSEKQLAVSTGWLPVSAMIGSGDNDTPVQPNVRALKRPYRRDPSQAMGAVA